MDRQQANALSLSDTDEASIASTSASEVKTLWRYTNLFITRTHAHTHMHNHLTAFGLRQPRVGQYQKKHSPTHTHPDHRTSFINFLHLLWSIASSVFSLRAWQSSLTTSLQVLFRLPLGLGPSTSYSMHILHPVIIFFSQHMPIHAHALFIIIIITSRRRDVLWHVSSSEQCRECWMMDAAAETHATHPMLLSTYLPCQSCTTNTQTRCKFDVYLLKNCNNYH